MESSGIGFGTLLFVIFLILKLTHTIDWSWWWVTAPLWLPISILIGVAGTAGLIAIIVMRAIDR